VQAALPYLTLNPKQTLFKRDTVFAILPLHISIPKFIEMISFKSGCCCHFSNPFFGRAINTAGCRVSDDPTHMSFWFTYASQFPEHKSNITTICSDYIHLMTAPLALHLQLL
jgi:hypothetical protein